jgi:hypothetical protein
MPITRRFTLLGWALWIVSLVTPDSELSGIGALIPFIGAMYGTHLFFGGLFELHSLLAALAGLGMLSGVAVNFTLFVPTNRWVSLASIAIPWIAVASVMAVVPRPEAIFTWLFFYPWALGIALIHIARLMSSTRSTPMAQTGAP